MLQPIEIDPKRFLRDHCTLPALPEVITKLQAVMQQDEIKLENVVNLVSGDPGLTAQILKVANSAYYSLPRDVSSIKFAVAYLGLNEIYRMVLALSVVDTIGVRDNDKLHRFWFHSYYTANCTKYLATKYEPHLSFEDLWSAAILHDIGKLIYMRFFPDHFEALESICRKEHCLFIEAEKKLGMPSSGYLGTLLCDHWRLPENVRLACQSRTLEDLHNISNTKKPSVPFQRTICLGNLLTILATEELAQETKELIATEVKYQLNTDDSNFLTLMGDIYYLKVEVEDFISNFT